MSPSSVANVSRTVIADAARRFPVRVIEVTAPPMCSPRGWHSARPRELLPMSRHVCARSVALPDHVHVETVMNDASLEEGVARFLAALNRAAADAAR